MIVHTRVNCYSDIIYIDRFVPLVISLWAGSVMTEILQSIIIIYSEMGLT